MSFLRKVYGDGDLNSNKFHASYVVLVSFCLLAVSAAPVSAARKIYTFDDQYVQIEAGTFSPENKGAPGIEVLMTPKPGWKLLAGNSSSLKPLRLKFAPMKCLKPKGATLFSTPDVAGTDDSGEYSEYFTKTASVRQEFSKQKCQQQSISDASATLSYLLCQDNKCMGPFAREIKFKAADLK